MQKKKKIHHLLILISLLVPNYILAQKVKPAKCILVFGAHADDVEQIAGGTLAKYIANGYEGIYVCAINNTAGCNMERAPGDEWGPGFTISNSPHKYPVNALETIQIRSEESKQACAVLGATPIFLDFAEPEFRLGRRLIIYGSDEFVQFNPPGRKQISLATRYTDDINVVVNLLKRYKPEIVIIHTLGGEKLDHGNSAYLMYLAFKEAMAQGIPVGKLWMTINGWLLDPAAQKTKRGKPDILIDVKKYSDLRFQALNKHVSQHGGFGKNYVHVQPRKGIEEFITVIDNMK